MAVNERFRFFCSRHLIIDPATSRLAPNEEKKRLKKWPHFHLVVVVANVFGVGVVVVGGSVVISS